jgi:Sulfotransferase family
MGQRWVLKSPMHLGYVDVLAELLPGTTFVQTHRDPITTMPSFASFVHGLWAATSDHADPREAARQWSATLEEHLNHCLTVRERLPTAQFIDVDFRETVTQPVRVVERIYERLGMPITERTRAGIESYMSTHPREGRPKHEYTLEEFGFDRADLERRFRAYREKHILPSQNS